MLLDVGKTTDESDSKQEVSLTGRRPNGKSVTLRLRVLSTEQLNKRHEGRPGVAIGGARKLASFLSALLLLKQRAEEALQTKEKCAYAKARYHTVTYSRKVNTWETNTEWRAWNFTGLSTKRHSGKRTVLRGSGGGTTEEKNADHHKALLFTSCIKVNICTY